MGGLAIPFAYFYLFLTFWHKYKKTNTKKISCNWRAQTTTLDPFEVWLSQTTFPFWAGDYQIFVCVCVCLSVLKFVFCMCLCVILVHVNWKIKIQKVAKINTKCHKKARSCEWLAAIVNILILLIAIYQFRTFLHGKEHRTNRQHWTNNDKARRKFYEVMILTLSVYALSILQNIWQLVTTWSILYHSETDTLDCDTKFKINYIWFGLYKIVFYLYCVKKIHISLSESAYDYHKLIYFGNNDCFFFLIWVYGFMCVCLCVAVCHLSDVFCLCVFFFAGCC